MRLVGREDVITRPWFATGHERAEHADELDGAVAAWIAARPTAVVLEAFEGAQAAVAPVYDVRGVMADPQYRALGTVQTVDDDELGPVKMQNVLFRLSKTPGSIRWPGRPHGRDTDNVLSELGLGTVKIAALKEGGIV